MSKSSTGKLSMYNEFEIHYGDKSWANGSYIVGSLQTAPSSGSWAN